MWPGGVGNRVAWPDRTPVKVLRNEPPVTGTSSRYPGGARAEKGPLARKNVRTEE